jgi:restriction endonuclease S subunit
MSDFEKELSNIVEENSDQEEVKLPSLEEQKEIVAKLKALEEAGELTQEIMAEHFEKYFAEADRPVH